MKVLMINWLKNYIKDHNKINNGIINNLEPIKLDLIINKTNGNKIVGK